MVRNEEQYQQAIAFRRRGFTYAEIAKICDVSKSTVSNWLSNEHFSQAVKEENTTKAGRENAKRIALLNKARKAERARRYSEAVRSAETEYKHYRKDPIFMAGVMLYLGVGDRNQENIVRLSSARPEVHRLFISFAVQYLGAPKDKVKFWLLLYPDHKEVAAMKYWSRKIGLSVAHFYKNQVVPGKSKSQTLQYGVGNTIIGSTVLKHKLDRWVELARKE